MWILLGPAMRKLRAKGASLSLSRVSSRVNWCMVIIIMWTSNLLLFFILLLFPLSSFLFPFSSLLFSPLLSLFSPFFFLIIGLPAPNKNLYTSLGVQGGPSPKWWFTRHLLFDVARVPSGDLHVTCCSRCHESQVVIYTSLAVWHVARVSSGESYTSLARTYPIHCYMCS